MGRGIQRINIVCNCHFSQIKSSVSYSKSSSQWLGNSNRNELFRGKFALTLPEEYGTIFIIAAREKLIARVPPGYPNVISLLPGP